MRACRRPVVVSPVLFEAVRFALALARETGGIFDPTVGRLLEAKGFDRDYRTGERARSQVPAGGPGPATAMSASIRPGARSCSDGRWSWI